MLTDPLAQDLVAGLDLEAQDHRPAVVYLNGEYWGLYTLTDHIDEDYLAARKDADPDRVDPWDWSQSDYGDLVDFAEDNDLSLAPNYEHVAARIDVANFIDHTIAEQFLANRDWPANDNVHWRVLPDGRWRWVFFDLDAGLELGTGNVFERMAVERPPDRGWSVECFATALYNNLLDNEGFRRRYLARFGELLDADFAAATTLRRYEALKHRYAPEVAEHARRWGQPASFRAWEDAVDGRLRRFLYERPCRVREQLAAFFGVDSLARACRGDAAASGWLVGPNPTSGAFALGHDREADVLLDELTRVDALGRVHVRRRNVLLGPGERIGLGGGTRLPPGVYLLVLDGGGRRESRRVVVVD